jgi:hypothetical protein
METSKKPCDPARSDVIQIVDHTIATGTILTVTGYSAMDEPVVYQALSSAAPGPFISEDQAPK